MKLYKLPKKITTDTVAHITRSLRSDILQGKLKSKVPLRQDEIATRFGVSKIPVREALFQLKAEGLVAFFPNRGAVVSELSADEVDEIYIMRIALETQALQRAIPHLTIANLAQAEEILETIDQEENIARLGELNWEFHVTLYSPANLPRLIEAVRVLHDNVNRYIIIYLSSIDYQKHSRLQHKEILDHCRHGDVEAALEHLEHHLQSASNKLIEFLKQRGP